MFFWCVPLSSDISKWDVSNVKAMKEMFTRSNFTSDISKWDVSNVTDMTHMLSGTNFDGDISKWDVSSVTNMKSMFLACPIPEENKPKFKE
jgi:surface protein